MSIQSPRQVYIYVQDFLPSILGSGTSNRIYSNVRAYRDLECTVELIYFQSKPENPLVIDSSLEMVKWSCVPVLPLPSTPLIKRANRLAYWLGWPLDQALNYSFKSRSAIKNMVQAREQATPGAIHHFEYLTPATAIIGLNHIRSVWSLHDIESDFDLAHYAMRRQAVGTRMVKFDHRYHKYIAKTERLVARRSQLILCIARHECEVLRQRWNCSHAEFFPMSLPVENLLPRHRPWVADGKLRLFHLGRIDSVSSFWSFQFLLGQVFPLLPLDILAQIELLVVGDIPPTARAQVILDLARPYPQVQFMGYQEDIQELYGTVDLQVVGSTIATGLRTRVVESFAFGLPVLSTYIGAAGVEGLRAGENIYLADSPQDFADALTNLLHNPQRLESIAVAGRQTYCDIYSRAAVANRLSALLTQYYPRQGALCES